MADVGQGTKGNVMYRMLEVGDVSEASDELWEHKESKWIKIPEHNVGKGIERPITHIPTRRWVPDVSPDAPKPFTPNKYTRDMPTLDGRKVPVDVYCVLAAFPTGSAAVDHAVKKQLAPGQRGTKSRLQDLKEAHASLGRAIELEEGQDASP